MLNLRADVVRQASALAVLGGSACAARYAINRTTLGVEKRPDVVATTHLRKHRPLLGILDSLATIDTSAMLPGIIADVEHALGLADQARTNGSASAARVMHDLVGDLNRSVRALVDAARKGARGKLLEACVRCVEDTVPALESILDQLLHNAMLDVPSTL